MFVFVHFLCFCFIFVHFLGGDSYLLFSYSFVRVLQFCLSVFYHSFCSFCFSTPFLMNRNLNFNLSILLVYFV